MGPQMDDIEIIEFTCPLQNNKNILVTNLSQSFEEVQLESTLHDAFSQYGLLYEVQIFSHDTSPENAARIASGLTGYYAFVKFYSARAAAKAVKALTGRLFFHGQHAKVRFASRRKELNDEQTLYMSKCYELANHYLGFDGWNTQILNMRPDSDEADAAKENSTRKVRYICVVKLNLPKHKLHAEAVGLGEQTWDAKDPPSKSGAICKARKHCYQRSVENAFRKIVLVVLGDGRVHVEVNTTLEEALHYDDDLKQQDMIKVNELDEDPEEKAQDEDDLNMHLLQELENGEALS